jgi:hypothetical protein
MQFVATITCPVNTGIGADTLILEAEDFLEAMHTLVEAGRLKYAHKIELTIAKPFPELSDDFDE